jgi:flavin reductase (DIM6/NTAB) family NADH-FMN oxidoreductase RutF
MQDFTSIKPTEITDNVFKLLDKDWMLVTAGNMDDFNTMTAAWGHLGILWNMPIAIAYIRPQRYTFGFTNRYEDYTLTFFTEAYRPALNICGTKSGRDCDKVAEAGLTPMKTERGNVIFREARLVLECRKVYEDDLKKNNFLDQEIIRKHYPKEDFHRFYMGEIVNAWMVKGEE